MAKPVYKTLLPDQEPTYQDPEKWGFWIDIIPDRVKEPIFYSSLIPWLIIEDQPQMESTKPSSLNTWNSLVTGSLAYDREKYPLTQPPVLDDGITWPSFYTYLYPSLLTQYAQRGLPDSARVPGISWSPGITVGFYSEGVRTWLPVMMNFGKLMQPILTSEPSRRTSPSGPDPFEPRELPYWLQD